MKFSGLIGEVFAFLPMAAAGVNVQELRQLMDWTQLNTAQKYIEQARVAAEQQIKRNKDKLW